MTLPIKTKPLTTFDKIKDWYFSKDGTVELSPKVEKIRLRWSKAWTLLNNFHSPSQAAMVLEKETGVKQAQAFRDVRNAINLFGDVNKSSKEGYRHILYEYSMKALQLAIKDKDLTEMNRAIANMAKLKGLDREDPDIPDFSRLDIGTIEVNVPQDMMELVKNFIGKGVINVSDFNPENVEDVQFEDVSNEEKD